MKLRNLFLILVATTMMANNMAALAADKDLTEDLLDHKESDRKTNGVINSESQPLTGDRVVRIRELFDQDYENNVKDLISSRWYFRKLANYTESLGNGLLYLGTGLSTIATGVTIVGSKDSANTIQFISTACFATHVIFIGFARCSAKEENEREEELNLLGGKIGYGVVPVKVKISDAEDIEKNASQNK